MDAASVACFFIKAALGQYPQFKVAPSVIDNTEEVLARKFEAMARPTPECIVRYNSETRLFAFEVRFAGQRPHYAIDVFEWLDMLMRWIDPHNERVWEEPSDADEIKILISRWYKEGSVPWRIAAPLVASPALVLGFPAHLAT
jgi:hypothetical protein